MKKISIILLAIISLSVLLSGCSSSSSGTKQTETTKVTEATTEKKNTTVAATEAEKKESTTSSTSKTSSSSSSKKSSSPVFTNKYGTATTKCAKAGCNNYIASSGDTAYCTTHSNRCLECNKYIDGDAMYCLDCLSKAVSDIQKDNSSSYGGGSGYGSSSYSGNNSSSGGYGYDSSDPYYSANDHDGDGKINDQEFQDAMNDLLDDLLASQDY